MGYVQPELVLRNGTELNLRNMVQVQPELVLRNGTELNHPTSYHLGVYTLAGLQLSVIGLEL